MCRYYDVHYRSFTTRRAKGLSIEESLFGKTKIIDHKGNKFKSYESLAKFYGIPSTTIIQRLDNDWTIEETVTGQKYNYIDHLGNGFKTITEMLDFWKLSNTAYNERLSKGYSLKHTLESKYVGKICKDHLGNDYASIKDMVKKYNINRCTYQQRIATGWSIEDALTTTVKKYNYPQKRQINNISV